jgi:hypothetical protein
MPQFAIITDTLDKGSVFLWGATIVTPKQNAITKTPQSIEGLRRFD